MTKDSAANKGFSLPFARIALVLAALIALGAVAVAMLRPGAGGESPASAAPGTAPATPDGQVADVGAMIGGLEQKMKETPDDPRGWNLLGQAYYHVGRYPDSAKAYARAAELDSKNAATWSALGEVQLLSGPGGVTPAAQASFAKALAIDPKDHRARYFMAVKKDADGNHKGAVDDLIAVLRESPAGAPWIPPVRQLTEKIAAEHKIDIAGRMPAMASATPAPAMEGQPISDPAVTDGIPGPTAQDLKAATSMTPAQQDEMARGMVDRLDARLKDNPRDADRWIMLMRSRMQLKQVDAAKAALARAKATFKDDPRQQARFDQAAQLYNVPR